MGCVAVYQVSAIENGAQLKPVLEFCYDILGQKYREYENYTYGAWQGRIGEYSPALLYAHVDGEIIAAVLGRPEDDGMVMGFVACHKDYRRQGVTSTLVKQFETNSKALGFKRITLGAGKDAQGFYDKCGYCVIHETDEQRVYRKIL